MTTPPTPAEVADARAWFERRRTRYGTGPEYWIADGGDGQRHAAVLVRAALAAPAEQPREDDPLREFAGWLISMDDPEDVNGREERRIVTLTTIINNARTALTAARSVPPSAVPAVSAGGAGRDLTAQDVQEALDDWLGDDNAEVEKNIAEHLNAIARPAAPRSSDASIVDEICDELGIERNEVVETMHRYHVLNMAFDECVRTEVARRLAATGTQATEQTTEYRVAMDFFGPLWMAVTADEVAAELRAGRRMEQRSVSPWSPLAVHDENGAQA